jgi:uncharacterized protein YecE (DUF72 family)
MHARTQPQARPVRLGSAEVYTGTCSWTRGFEQWYPPHLRTSSAGRLAYYASHFPVVEIDSTYYALPRLGQTGLLARGTPQGFLFGIKALGPLTGHSTSPARLPEPARLTLPRSCAPPRACGRATCLGKPWRSAGTSSGPA